MKSSTSTWEFPDCSFELLKSPLQPYDQVAVAEITLVNSGKVGFPFSARGVASEDAGTPPWGVPMLKPSSAFIPANSQLRIEVRYLPGVPEFFERRFEVQVAHFEADTVRLRGEGAFPRISLDLPRLPGGEALQNLVREVRAEVAAGAGDSGRLTEPALSPAFTTARPTDREGLLSELEVQLEVERRVLAEFSAAMASGAEPPSGFKRTKNGKVK